jgi:hypothetical protein
MSVKKIKELNGPQFVADLKRVRNVMCYTSSSRAFFHLKKSDVKKRATEDKIHYYMTETLFVVKRMVMVII